MRPLQPSAAERSGRAPLLGAHISVSGGMARAIERAAELGCTSMQVFVKNQQQWRGRTLAADDIQAFADASHDTVVRNSLAHASYLINLASPDDTLYLRSIEAMRDEMRRCAALGIPALVVHPGAHKDSGEASGLGRITAALRDLLALPGAEGVSILLESTAGQGTSLGHTFEHLASLLHAGPRRRLGVCIDTCHLLAAGHEWRTPKGYAQVFREIDVVIGLRQVRAFHLNDSKVGLGGRVDRHAEIGAGHIGRAPFQRLLNDERFAGVPMVLETPGGQEGYRRNLRLLRGMLRSKRRV